jgi:death-on-curing protein
MEALIRNHGFVDGNKRTAVMAAAFRREREGFALKATQDEVVETALSVAERRLDLEGLTAWFEANSVPLSPGDSC